MKMKREDFVRRSWIAAIALIVGCVIGKFL